MTSLAVLSLVVASEVAAAADRLEVDTAIVFALDISLSMDPVELKVAREGLAEAIVAPAVLQAIGHGDLGRIVATYVEFAGTAQQVVGWSVIDGPAAAAAFATAVRAVQTPTEPDTDISSALYLADTLFDRMPYRAGNLIVDVVGDGIDASTLWLKATRGVLLARGAVINGLPLVIDPSEPDVAAFYATRLAGGPGSFSMPVTRIEQMPQTLRRKIVRELF